MTNFYANEFIKALIKRNEIEEAKLELEKQAFLHNQKMEKDNLECNNDMIAALKENLQVTKILQEQIDLLSKNQHYFYLQLEEIKGKE